MSCLLDEIGIIKDINEILPWLCPHLAAKEELRDWDDWGDDLKCEIDNQYKVDENKEQETIPWLEECHVAVSPFMDLIVLACKNRLAFFEGRWEKLNKNVKKDFFSNIWRGVVGHDQNDEVTCVLCLPIISQKQSSSGAPDWTCVIVGYTSGYLSFYTENGLLLLSQMFEEQRACRIYCRTYIPENYGACPYSDLTEELVILYPKSIISIDGFSLLQTLKACRNQAAKAAASGEDCLPKMVTLDYKKFGLNDQESVSDVTASGVLPPHLYDKVIFESFSKGFNTPVTSGVATTTQIMTVGRSPFFGILGIKEGSVQPFIADIAMHYASKLKNAIVQAASGWLFGNKRQPTENSPNLKPKTKIEQPLQIPFRHSLSDERRLGSSIALSLSRRLAAVTDDFGRVSIVDVQRCNVIRMLKGYRDAKCGWVTVSGEWNRKDREVLFLVIHAPKRNILEVWLPQQGPRVAAFNVEKDARLLYTPHTYLGANTQKGRNFNSMSVVLLHQKGTLQRISIPFHLALSGKTNKQSKDLHLLKTLKSSIRYETESQVVKILQEIQTPNVKLQALSYVVSSRHVTLSLVKSLLALYQNNEDEPRLEDMDHESRILTQQLSRLSQLTEFYETFLKFIFTVHDRLHESEIKKKISVHLMLPENLICLFMELLQDEAYLRSNKLKQVSFMEERMSYSSFLHCWDLITFHREATSIIPVHFSKKLLNEKKLSLANFLYGWSYHPSKTKIWFKSIIDSGLDTNELTRLAFIYWHNLSSISSTHVLHMAIIVLSLAVLKQPVNVFHPTALSPYWENIRGEISEWCKPLHAFIVTHICSGAEAILLAYSSVISEMNEESQNPLEVTLRLIEILELKKDTTIDEFEELCMEMVEWKVLLKRCKHLLSLQKLFNAISNTGVSIQPDYSIRAVISKGKGHVSELVAKWLIELELEPKKLLHLIKNLETLSAGAADETAEKLDGKDELKMDASENNKNDSEMKDISCDVNKNSWEEQIENIRECLKCVQFNFPHSMVEDALKLNVSWEFGAVWKKSPTKVNKLESSVLFLTEIENVYCRHGIGCLLWENLVQSNVQNCVQIIERRRGPPSVAYNSPEFCTSLLPKMLNATKDLLESIIHGEARISLKASSKLTLEADEFWRDVRGTLPLIEVAVAQQVTSSDLTYIHHQLLCVMSLIVTHNVTGFRPVSLFPERDRASFFKPLITSWKSTSDETRRVVNCHQLNFLNRVITCVVLALSDVSVFDPKACLLEPSSVVDCVNLGRSWGVAIDALRRHYICELYSSGLDPMADYGLMKINDGVMMASQMIQIARQRLRYLMTSHNNAFLIIPFVTPNVKNWCMALDPASLRCPDVPIHLTVAMVFKATTFMRETSPDYNLGHRLLKALQMVKESNILEKTS